MSPEIWANIMTAAAMVSVIVGAFYRLEKNVAVRHAENREQYQATINKLNHLDECMDGVKEAVAEHGAVIARLDERTKGL